MAEQPHAVEAAHPPAAMVRVVNPTISLLLQTPLFGNLGKQLMVLSFNGRKSGRRYSIPVSAHVIDDELYALTGASWKQNFRDGAAVRVAYDGKTNAMRGELVGDRGTVADLYQRCAQGYGVQRAQRAMGLKFRKRRIPTLDEFAEAVDRLHLGAVRLTPRK